MDMSPNQVRTATFSTVRKGWDPAEVAALLERAADALEQAQNHATAMEARARAAVAKLQDLTSGDATPSRPTPVPTPAAPQPAPAVAPATPSAPAVPTPTDDEREIISRTLLLAQRAADEALTEARQEADRLVTEARDAARREGADERQRVRDEVDALSARRGFLQSDVEHLENFLLDQRERLRSAAASLIDMAEKVPGGLGYLRPPLLTAGDDPVGGGDPEHGESGVEPVAGVVSDDDESPPVGDHVAEVSASHDEVRVGPVDDASPATQSSSDGELVIRLSDGPDASDEVGGGDPLHRVGQDDPTPPGLPQDSDAR